MTKTTRTLKAGDVVYRKGSKSHHGCLIHRDRSDEGFAYVEWFSAGDHQFSEYKLSKLGFVRERA